MRISQKKSFNGSSACIHKSKLIKISPVKILSSVILSLIFLVLWSCSDSGEPKLEGCTDSGACNYSIENTHDDGSCIYPETNYDCEGNCTATVDACNICGGEIDDVSDCCQEGQVLDCAGTCDGDAVADCNGDCGGSAVEDCAGTCDGSALLIDEDCTNISYTATIQPIFNTNCIGCHNGGHSSGLDLRTYAGVIAGGNSGAVIANNHANSLLWNYVNTDYMPPNGTLTSSQINLIETWINEGAEDN